MRWGSSMAYNRDFGFWISAEHIYSTKIQELKAMYFAFHEEKCQDTIIQISATTLPPSSM